MLTADKTVEVTEKSAYDSGDGKTNYTSSVEDGVTLTFNVNHSTEPTHAGIISGNISLVINFDVESPTNKTRFKISSASNSFTGPITVNNGILNFTNGEKCLGKSTSITLNEATLMGAGKITQNLYLGEDFGALRASGYTLTIDGQISGSNLLIANDGNTVLLNNTNNNYTGVTNVGYKVSGNGNSQAHLKLGASEVLSDTTVVLLGVDYFTGTQTSAANINMNGFTETIAGLVGVGKLVNNETPAVTLNIATNTKSADGFYTTYAGTEGYNFTGPIGSVGKGLLTVNISGDGTQILGGSFTNSAVTVSDTATLSFGANTDVKTLNGLNVANGATLKATDNATISVDGDVNLSGTLSANALTITQTGAGSIYLGQAYNGLTVNVNQGTYVENGIANSANIVMTADSTHDLNGKTATVDTLIGKYVNTSANMATLNFGNDTDATYAGNFTESANITLVKQGMNTVTLTGEVNTPSLTVNSGTLNLTGSGDLTKIEVATGGNYVHAFKGTISEMNLTGGTVKFADGNGNLETLTLNSLTGFGTIEIALDSIVNNSDALIVFTDSDWENIDLSGLTLEFASERPAIERLGEEYTIFSGLPLAQLAQLQFDSLYHYSVDANGVATFSVNPNAVPEPSTWGLLLVGLGVGFFFRKRKEFVK